MSRAMRSIVVALIGATIFVVPTPASACSCAVPTELATWVSDSPAAMVGTLIGVEPGSDPFGRAVFRFEVEQWVKGDVGPRVDIHSVVGDGGNCGLFPNVGERMGLVLYVDEGLLSSNSCLMVSPDLLLAVEVDPDEGIPGLGSDDGLVLIERDTPIDEAQGSTDLARAVFIALMTGGAISGAVAYLRRDRQVNPPSAF